MLPYESIDARDIPKLQQYSRPSYHLNYLVFSFIVVRKHMKFSILTSFKCTIQWNISRPSSSCQSETVNQLNNSSPYTFPLALVTAMLLSVCMILTISDTPCKWSHTVFVFCVSLILLSIMSSTCTHNIACDGISSLLKRRHRGGVGHCTYTTLQPLFLCWVLGCFYLLALVSSSAMNIAIFLWLPASSSFCYIPKVGLLEYTVVFLTFSGMSVLVFLSSCSILFSLKSMQVF